MIFGRETANLLRAYRVSTKRNGEFIQGKKTMKRETQNTVVNCATRAQRSRRGRFAPLVAFGFLALPPRAYASLFHGETLDAIANGISWVVLVIGPIIGIAVFWMVR